MSTTRRIFPEVFKREAGWSGNQQRFFGRQGGHGARAEQDGGWCGRTARRQGRRGARLRKRRSRRRL